MGAGEIGFDETYVLAPNKDDAIAQLERGLREEVGGGDAVRALRELAAIRRNRGEERLAEGLERLATRRETTGSKRAD